MRVKSRVARGLIIGCLVFGVSAAAGVYGLQAWYNSGLKPVSETVVEQEFVIKPGDSTAVISDRLYSEGFIRNARVFNYYVSRQGGESLKAGVYRLSPHLSVSETAQILIGGVVDTRFVTIVPGLRLDEVADRLVEQGFNRSEVDAALSKRYDHPLFKDLPDGATFEGYLYPETIQVTSQTSVEDLLERFFDTFYSKLSTALLNDIAKQGLTLHEAVTLASLVQLEVSEVEIQPTVAQVFLKRLNEGEVLGSDVTFFYAAAILGVEPSTTIDSPYNTRIYGGLPPGPVSNFNFSALEAVARPSDTDFLYFVSGDDGETYFSKTEEEHNRSIELHCTELCEIQ